jgi:6-phosphofructokinase 1
VEEARIDIMHNAIERVVAVFVESKGESIVDPLFTAGRSVYYGDVGAHLANLIIRRLDIKARCEKPGICGRTSIAWQSEIDRQEAILAGEEAVRVSLAGKTGFMVGFERQAGPAYRCATVLIPFDQVMLHEKKLPEKFIAGDGTGPNEEFADWCRPLIGSPLPGFIGTDDILERRYDEVHLP